MLRARYILLIAALTPALLLPADGVWADPCGMVPPIYSGRGRPIERVGIQQTYVFYRGGIETIAIRPGFRGKVDEFGMLIPFPTPPELRKLPDKFFSHIANAAEPPEVVMWVRRPSRKRYSFGAGKAAATDSAAPLTLSQNRVRVIRREAVGMYEVAVLEAGSPKALKRWMDQHRYKYPKGMDVPVGDYVKAGWCFVAVRTRVGGKSEVNPRPGQRRAKAKFPSGAGFTGAVQAMGFRFRTKQLVVPMRLSAFNGGRMRNVVYLLSDSPKRIDRIPEKYVVRQIPGRELYRNLTSPLPLRVIGGTKKQLSSWQRNSLKRRRDQNAVMKYAQALFGGDLLAARKQRLSHKFEEQEKELVNIGEALDLRGPAIDQAVEKLATKQSGKRAKRALRDIKQMTLTVVDGDFARSIVANHNLTFSGYRMPRNKNHIRIYDPKSNQPGRPRIDGKLYRGSLPPTHGLNDGERHARRSSGDLWVSFSLSFLALALLWRRRRS